MNEVTMLRAMAAIKADAAEVNARMRAICGNSREGRSLRAGVLAENPVIAVRRQRVLTAIKDRVPRRRMAEVLGLTNDEVSNDIAALRTRGLVQNWEVR